MGRHSSCLKQKLRKGLWSPEEDEKLFNHITLYGVGCWSSVPKLAGLQRCGKSCRLRWINYLRPDLKRGMFSQQEEDLILRLHQVLGNRWAQIAAQLPGRTDNEIKNFWNSYLKKKLMKQGIDPATHKPFTTRDQIELKSENSNSPTDTEPSLLPPSVIRPSEPAFLLGDPIDFPLQHGIGPNKAFFNLSPVLEFHRSVTSHPVNCSTSLLAGHRQCQNTSTRPTNVAGFPGMIGEESASSDGLASKMSSLFFDEAITTDDPRTNIIPGYQINSDNGENNYGGAFSWGPDCYNKLDPSSNQFQFDGVIKSDEALEANPWSRQEEPIVTSYNALHFGDYPLTSISEDFDVLQDL